MRIINAKVRKRGKSLWLIIPKEIVKTEGISKNKKLKIIIFGETLFDPIVMEKK